MPLALPKFARLICAALALIALSPSANAIQLLVRPGDDWSALAAKARPGDEIILMPGTHKSASLDGLTGTSAAPITIRSIDRDHVALIEGAREGLRLRRPQNVIIQDLTISGASVSGISISDDDFARPGSRTSTSSSASRSAESFGNITIRKVNILKTGPKGQRNALAISGMENVRIEQCAIVGWGGSAMEIIACRNVQIKNCSMRGLEDFTQNQGLRIRAGSEGVFVDQCRFESAGVIAICLGGTSRPVEFRLLSASAPASANAIEARDVNIERSFINGGEISIDARAVLNCRIRGNTILNPRACLIRAADLKTIPATPGERAPEGLHLTNNLFVWEAGGIQRLMDTTNSVDKSMMQVEQNLWWSPETDLEKKKRGDVEGSLLFEQLLDVDPMLNDTFHPANSAAELFGMYAP